jgi:hypothetical protein
LLEKLGASPVEFLLRSKEICNEVEGAKGPAGLEADALLPRHIGKPVGYICAASKNHTFHLGSDCRQRSADTVAAI